MTFTIPTFKRPISKKTAETKPKNSPAEKSGQTSKVDKAIKEKANLAGKEAVESAIQTVKAKIEPHKKTIVTIAAIGLTMLIAFGAGKHVGSRKTVNFYISGGHNVINA